MFVSQPLLGFPSQSAQPAAQLGTQAPAVQLVDPLGLTQTVPQEPQLEVEVSAVSQPLPSLPSQLPKPELQAPKVHVPPLQVAVALLREHGTPQPPQSLDVLVLVSQPLLGLPSQSAQPLAHVGEQTPEEQVVDP